MTTTLPKGSIFLAVSFLADPAQYKTVSEIVRSAHLVEKLEEITSTAPSGDTLNEWAKEDGDLGPVYGVQWRSWPTPDGQHIDQISEVIRTLRTNPDSRRIIVSAWNVADLSKMALMPCHAFFQFYVAPAATPGGKGQLSCQLYQRSADIFLGVPFNIASYALLTHMVAQQCDLDVGEFIWTGGDCHIYNNHVEQVQLQLSRAPFPSPRLHIQRKPDSIFEYAYEDFEVLNYQCHPAIKAPVAV